MLRRICIALTFFLPSLLSAQHPVVPGYERFYSPVSYTHLTLPTTPYV